MRALNFIKWLLLLLPILEIAGFILVGEWLGVLPTLALIVFTSFLGICIVRGQFFTAVFRLRHVLKTRPQELAVELRDQTLITLGGLLLVIPGFITDVVGICCLVPSMRQQLWRILFSHRPAPPASGRIIEGEFQREDDKP